MSIFKIVIGGFIFMLLLDISKWVLELAVTKPEYGFLILTTGILISLLSYGFTSFLLRKSIKSYANRINENIDSKFDHQIKAEDKALSILIKESLGNSNRSIASMIGATDKSIVSMIGTTDKSIASMIGDANTSLASMIGSCDKSLVGLLGNSESGSVNYKLDTLISENQKHKEALASMNTDTKQIHHSMLAYTQKFEENARLIEELKGQVESLKKEKDELKKEIERLNEENQSLKQEIKTRQENEEEENLLHITKEEFEDLINDSKQNKDMNLER